MAKKLKYSLSMEGFSLLEVLMALTIFSLFITAFMMSQGHNITSSTYMREDMMLHNLCERKMSEVLLNPPEFTNATEKDIETKNFDEDGITNYKYSIEFKKLEIPNFAQLTGKESDEEDDQTTMSASGKNDAIKKMVYDKLKKNMEEILWQVKVKVTNTETNYNYELTSWITNDKATIDTNFAF